MKKLLTSALCAVSALALTGCVEPDWESEEQRRAVFEDYICDRGVESGRGAAMRAANHVLDMHSASQRDRDIALQLIVGRGNERTAPVPPSVSPSNSGTCHGWVWNYYLDALTEAEYEYFTYRQAEHVGYAP